MQRSWEDRALSDQQNLDSGHAGAGPTSITSDVLPTSTRPSSQELQYRVRPASSSGIRAAHEPTVSDCQPPSLTFYGGDEVFREEGFPSNLMEQLRQHCREFRTSDPSCARYIGGRNTHPNSATADGNAAPFVVPYTNEVLLVAYFAFSNRKILVARQKNGSTWMSGEAAILVNHGRKSGKRTKWHVWHPSWPKDRFDENSKFAERAVQNQFHFVNGELVLRGDACNETGRSRLAEHQPNDNHNRDLLNCSGDGDDQDHMPTRHQHGIKRSLSSLDREATNALPLSCQKTAVPSLSGDDDGDRETVLDKLFGPNEKTVRKPAKSASDVANETLVCPTAEASPPNPNTNDQCVIDGLKDADINFIFKPISTHHQPQTRHFAACNTVQKLFTQALCRWTATRESQLLQVRIKDVADPIRIMRGDEEDFEQLKRALNAKAQDGKPIEAVVEVLDFV